MSRVDYERSTRTMRRRYAKAQRSRVDLEHQLDAALQGDDLEAIVSTVNRLADARAKEARYAHRARVTR